MSFFAMTVFAINIITKTKNEIPFIFYLLILFKIEPLMTQRTRRFNYAYIVPSVVHNRKPRTVLHLIINA